MGGHTVFLEKGLRDTWFHLGKSIFFEGFSRIPVKVTGHVVVSDLTPHAYVWLWDHTHFVGVLWRSTLSGAFPLEKWNVYFFVLNSVKKCSGVWVRYDLGRNRPKVSNKWKECETATNETGKDSVDLWSWFTQASILRPNKEIRKNDKNETNNNCEKEEAFTVISVKLRIPVVGLRPMIDVGLSTILDVDGKVKTLFIK